MHLARNLILDTDSYKASHWLQYPPGVDATFFYLESRGGVYERTLFFGLQSILKEYLSRPVTAAMIDEAKAFFAAHGEPFNESGWRHIVDAHDGKMPLRIRDRKSTRLNSSHPSISYAVFCLKKKKYT